MLSKRTALRAATERKKRSVILSRRSAHSRVHREGVRSTVEGSGWGKSQSRGDRVSSAQILQCAPYALAVRLRGRTAPPQDDRLVDSRNPHKYWEFLRSRVGGEATRDAGKVIACEFRLKPCVCSVGAAPVRAYLVPRTLTRAARRRSGSVLQPAARGRLWRGKRR